MSVYIYFSKPKDFIFLDDGITMARSETHLYMRERAVNFNESFSNWRAASSLLFQSGDEVSQTAASFHIWSKPFPLNLSCAEQRFSARTRNCPIYLWFLSVSFHPIPQTPPVLSSVFSFYPFVFATDEKIAVIIGQVHMIPITCQSFHLSPGFQTPPLSQINELCLAFLISPTSFCLPMFLLPHRSWQILSLVLSFLFVIVTGAVSPSIIQEWVYCEGPLLRSVGSVLAVDANER